MNSNKKSVEISFFNIQLQGHFVCVEVEKSFSGVYRCKFSELTDIKRFRLTFFEASKDNLGEFVLRASPRGLPTKKLALQIWELIQPRIDNPDSRRMRNLIKTNPAAQPRIAEKKLQKKDVLVSSSVRKMEPNPKLDIAELQRYEALKQVLATVQIFAEQSLSPESYKKWCVVRNELLKPYEPKAKTRMVRGTWN